MWQLWLYQRNGLQRNGAVYTNMFLNSNYEPNRRIWGLPTKWNVKETSCEILFASSVERNDADEQDEYSQLWSGTCKGSFKHDGSNSVACYGSGARHAKPLLEAVRDEITSGNLCHEEILIKLLNIFKSTSEKDDGTGENILVYFLTRGTVTKLYDNHVDKVPEDVKALREKIEKKKVLEILYDLLQNLHIIWR